MACLFCAIATGDVPSLRVYEDDDVLAFLDIQPLREGHVLVIPRLHAGHLEELEEEQAAALMRACRRVLGATRAALGTQDATVAINDGPAAGQEIPHVHLHIVPRRPGDGAGAIHAMFADRPKPSQAELAKLADRIAQHAGGP